MASILAWKALKCRPILAWHVFIQYSPNLKTCLLISLQSFYYDEWSKSNFSLQYNTISRKQVMRIKNIIKSGGNGLTFRELIAVSENRRFELGNKRVKMCEEEVEVVTHSCLCIRLSNQTSQNLRSSMSQSMTQSISVCSLLQIKVFRWMWVLRWTLAKTLGLTAPHWSRHITFITCIKLVSKNNTNLPYLLL